MAYYPSNHSGKASKQIVNAWNDFNDSSLAGYVHLVRIKILNVHAVYPLSFTITGRGFNKLGNLTVLFEGGATIDPNIYSCTYDVEFTSSYNYKFYIVKEATSTWSIYVSRQGYATVAVIGAEIFRMKSREMFEVTYPNALVDSLPDGALEFKEESPILIKDIQLTNVAVYNKMAEGLYWTGLNSFFTDNGINANDIISISLKTWQDATGMFNIYINNVNGLGIMSTTAQTIGLMSIRVAYLNR